MLDSLRQWLLYEELRIAPPDWPPEAWPALERLARDLEARAPVAAPAEAPPAYLAELGTGLWRLRARMVQPGTDRPLEEMRRAYRHLESMGDVLVGAGLTIQDHTGAAFDAGMSLKVIAYQPTPGLAREKVIETIKPSIYYRGVPIQVGEVIVGTPEKP